MKNNDVSSSSSNSNSNNNNNNNNNNGTWKWLALFFLVLQNSSLALVMRATFLTSSSSTTTTTTTTTTTNDPNPNSTLKAAAHLYLASTAVLLTEILKLFLSIVFCFLIDAHSNPTTMISILKTEVFVNEHDWMQLSVPSLLYTLQNSLQYISMSQLSAPVFQLLYQMKIVSTAVFSVLLLGKRISVMQWIAIVALTGGVALVQLSQHVEHDNSNNNNNNNSILGFITVLCGCVTSGYAGVYFEMILKNSTKSLWVRNIQLSTIGVVMGLLSCLWRNYRDIAELGFFVGYNSRVWSVILLQAAGGLIVALVVKFADNVLKVFATSLSILVSSFISWKIMQDFELTTPFLFGTFIVLSAVFLFTVANPMLLLLPYPSFLKPIASSSSLLNHSKEMNV